MHTLRSSVILVPFSCPHNPVLHARCYPAGFRSPSNIPPVCRDRGKPTPHSVTCPCTSQKDGMRAEDYVALRVYLSLAVHNIHTSTHKAFPFRLIISLCYMHLCPQWICSACLSTSASAEVEIFLGKGWWERICRGTKFLLTALYETLCAL